MSGEYGELFFEGFLNSTLIVLFSLIVPLILGCALTALARIHPVVGKVFEWLSLPFEILSPMSFLLVMYFCMFGNINIPKVLIVSLALGICYIGYMPSRHVPSYSVWKNLLYNGLGLIRTAIIWSSVVGYIGVMDLQKAANAMLSIRYEPHWMWIPLVVYAALLLSIEVGRRLVKQLMK